MGLDSGMTSEQSTKSEYRVEEEASEKASKSKSTSTWPRSESLSIAALKAD